MSKDLAQKQNEMELQKVEWDLHEVEEAKPLEFTEENKAELLGIDPAKANEMVSGLQTTLSERQVLKDAYIDVIDLEITTENVSTFKELRLKIMKNRTQGLTKWKEKEKAFYLAGGNFIQAIYNKEVAVNEEMEAKLLEAEKFFENQEKEKKRLINLERVEKIRPYVEDITGLDFSEMNDYDFEDYVLGKKTRFENEKAEKERLEKEAESERLAEIERQKAIEIENAKLKAEAEAKEKALAEERAEAKAKQDAIELKAKQEREKAEAERKIEADKQAKIQAEKDAEIAKLKAEKEKEEAGRIAKEKAEKLEAEKLAKAPIKKQLSVWVESFELPKTDVYNDTEIEIKEKFQAFKKWAQTQVNNL